MKRKITVFIVATAPSAIALVAAGFVSFASSSRGGRTRTDCLKCPLAS